MRKVAEVWPTEEEFVQDGAGQLPWSHVTVLLDRLDTREDRAWYAARALREGWKRGVMDHFIRAGLREQLGRHRSALRFDYPDNFADVGIGLHSYQLGPLDVTVALDDGDVLVAAFPVPAAGRVGTRTWTFAEPGYLEFVIERSGSRAWLAPVLEVTVFLAGVALGLLPPAIAIDRRQRRAQATGSDARSRPPPLCSGTD
jgi:hypothetical protein